VSRSSVVRNPGISLDADLLLRTSRKLSPLVFAELRQLHGIRHSVSTDFYQSQIAAQ
jgi:hypothetical protein